MKKLTFIAGLMISACTANIYPDCDYREPECGLTTRCVCKDRDTGRVQIDNPPPAPPPKTNDPETPVKEVCDGGARACRDGEEPTGTEDDPTKYLEDK